MEVLGSLASRNTNFEQYAAAKTQKITQQSTDHDKENAEPINYYPVHSNSEKLVKQKPSMIIYRRGDPEINNNGKVLDEAAKPIFCRQLAFESLCKKQARDKRWRTTFSSPESLREQTSLAKNYFDKKRIDFRADEYHKCDIDNFGSDLHNTVKNIKPGETKLILFHSENHTMSITVNYKNDNITSERYTISFFDPNLSASDVRVVCQKLEDIKKLKLRYLLSKSQVTQYFPKLRTTVLAVYYDPIQTMNNSENIVTHQPVFMDFDIDADRLPDLLYFGLFYNNHILVEVLCDHIINTDLTNQKKCEAMEARDNDGNPGLFAAIQENHSKTVRLYIEIVLRSEIKSTDKFNLIQAINANGHTGLFIGIYRGNKEIVKLYIEIILASNLSNELKLKLIAAIDGNYNTQFMMSLKKLFKNAMIERNIKLELAEYYIKAIYQFVNNISIDGAQDIKEMIYEQIFGSANVLNLAEEERLQLIAACS